MGIFICGCGRNFKRGFVNVPEKYIYVEQNLSKKISVLENAGSTKAAALMQMIIEEIQLRQANYRYTVSTLAFNLVLFFDRLDNENIKFQNNSRETSDYTRKTVKETIGVGVNEKAALSSDKNCPFVYINFDFTLVNKVASL